MKNEKLRLNLYMGALCYIALCTCMANNIVGPLLGDIMTHYSISLDRGGMMSLFQNIGGTLAIVLLSVIMDKLNKPLSLLFPLLLLPACLFLISVAPSYPVFMMMYLLVGMCLSTSDMMSNAVVPDIQPEKRDAALSLLHGFAPVGAFIVPVVAGAIIDAGTPWQRVYFLIGLLCVTLLIAYVVTFALARKQFRSEGVKARQAKDTGAIKRMLRDYRVYVAAGCVFLFGAFQSGLSVWGVRYCKELFGLNAVEAGVIVTIYWAATGLTRILFSFTRLKTLETRPVILYGSIAAGVTFCAGLLSGNYAVLLVCTFVTGCLNAQVIPRAVGLATGWYKENSGMASSTVLTFLYVAFATSPLLLGAVANKFGMQVILYLPAVFTVLAGVLAIALPREQTR